MAKRKRTKYNNGGLQISKTFENVGELSGNVAGNQSQRNFSFAYKTPETHHSFGVKGDSNQGITGFSGSTGTAKNRIKANVGVGSRKGQYGVTASRNIRDGEISATVNRQQKPFSSGRETYVGIQFTKRF